MSKPAKFLAYGDAPEEVGVLAPDTMTVTTFTPVGELSNVRTAYFYETGASGFGRIGFWAYASGRPVDGPQGELDVIAWK